MSKLNFDVFKLYAVATKSFFMDKLTELTTRLDEISNPETVTATGADYAACVKWADENPSGKDRTGYFVQIAIGTGDGTQIEIAQGGDYIMGVTTNSAAFVENYTKNSVGNPLYALVGLLGLVDVIDNGTCTVGQKCMPADDGTAVPSNTSTGYHVISRTDATHVKIMMAVNTDMIQRISKDVVNIDGKLKKLETISDAIAKKYDSKTSYVVDDLCFHEYTLYKCTAPTTGDWNQQHWKATCIADEIKSIEISGGGGTATTGDLEFGVTEDGILTVTYDDGQ